jgi:predicted dehydrogenase
MKPIQVAIVGLGTISQRLYDAVCACEGMQLTAICQRNADRLALVSAQWGIERTFTDYTALLQEPAIDAVILATPNHLHAPMTIAALNAGKNVFCEKPPAISAEEAQQVQACAKQTGKLVMYGFMFRFSEKHNLIKRLCDEGMFGEIYYAKAGIIRRYGDPGGWFSDKSRSGGGSLIDLGSHIIDLSVRLMGDPEPVSVFSRSFRNTENLNDIRATEHYQALSEGTVNDVEEHDVVMVNFANGACLMAETSTKSHIKEETMYLELLGSRGGVTVDPEIEIHTVQHDLLFDSKPRINCNTFDYQGAINAEMRHFADCLQNGTTCISSVDAGVKLMKIISAAYRSQVEMRLVDINEFS